VSSVMCCSSRWLGRLRGAAWQRRGTAAARVLVSRRALVNKKVQEWRDVSAMSWNCVVLCRRVRAGVDEVLLQWEGGWIDADEVPPGKVVEVLLRRTVRGQNQMLVQWACTWTPVELCDSGALEEYDGDVIIESATDVPAVSQALGAGGAAAPKVKRRKHKNNW
jgi:hypothetical protein